MHREMGRRWIRVRLGSRWTDGGGSVEDYFWGTLSLAVLVVLVGLLVVMLTEDVRRALEQRRH